MGLYNPPATALVDSNLGLYNVRDYGAAVNDKVVTDAAITSGTATLTSATAGFTSADVGKSITINYAQQTPAPGTLTVTNVGTAGSTTYYYVVTALGLNGGETTVSPEASTTTAANTLTTANYNTISWTTVNGAQYYKVYRGTSSGTETLLGYCQQVSGTTVTFTDKIQTPTLTGSPPGSNTAAYPLTTTIAGYTNATTVTLTATPSFTATAQTAGYGTDDTSAIQAAISAAHAAGGGTVLIPPSLAVTNGTGACRVTGNSNTPITLYSNVSISGVTCNTSIIRSYGSYYSTLYALGSSGTPLTGCTFRDFQLDGSMMSDQYLYVASKGINFSYNSGTRSLNLYIHHYPATGLATDNGVDQIIDGCNCSYNGRLGRLNNVFGTAVNPGNNALGTVGSSGIGLGAGGQAAIEDTIISNCTCNYNGNNGIFFEHETGDTYIATGMRIVNCTTIGNYGCGISDSGTSGILIEGNFVSGNLCGGGYSSTGLGQINISSTGVGESGSDGGKIVNNIVVGTGTSTGATLDGIYIYGVDSANPNAYEVAGNRVSNCGRWGINLIPTSAADGFAIKNNTVFNNGQGGIAIRNACNYVTIDGNTVFNNGANASAFGSSGYGVLLTQTVTNLIARSNTCYDSQSTKTQTYGIGIGNGYTNGVIQNNTVFGNGTGGITGTGSVTTIVRDNPGYNPVGTTTTLSVGSSPWTYTAGRSPETLYLMGGAGMYGTVGGNSIIPSGSATAGPLTVNLEPNQALVLTYTTAPTAVTQVR